MDRRTMDRVSAAAAAAVMAGLISGSARAGGLLSIDFDEANFDDTPTMNGAVVMSMISNPYWPLSPDATYVRTFTYLGGGEDECVINKILVDPSEIKSDFGPPYEKIHAQVVLDQEWVVELEDGDECDTSIEPEADELTERTFDWYAQDIFWNVWYMGEHSRTFEDECPGPEVPDADAPDECFEGSWEAGQYGPEMEIIAEAGVIVPSDHPTGDGTISNGTYYAQEFAEGAEDMARVVRQGARLSVEDGIAPGEYEHCRKVKESTALEPGASVEHKWYCSDGPGLVLVQGIGGGRTENEVLVDVEMSMVAP
jgi:hypothetical protein